MPNAYAREQAALRAARAAAPLHPSPPSHRLAIAHLLDRLSVAHATPLHPSRRCRLHCGADFDRGPCQSTGAMKCKPPLGPRPAYITAEQPTQ